MEFSFSRATLINVNRGESALAKTKNNRQNNLMLLKTSGETLYRISDRVFPLKAGYVILIPDKSSYSVKTSQPGSYIAVTFASDCVIESPVMLNATSSAELFEKLLKTFTSDLPSKGFKCNSILYDIFYRLSTQKSGVGFSSESLNTVNLACSDIEKNFSNPDFRFSTLHTKYGISSVYLCKLFKRIKGKTPSEYLISVRLENARRLLSEGRGVSSTAYAVGFQDPLYFSKFFKKHTGCSPSDYYDLFAE